MSESEKPPVEQPAATEVVSVQAAELVKLRERDAQYGSLESSTKGFVIASQVNAALAGRQDLVPGAAAKIARDIRDQFTAQPSGDDWTVASRDGKTVADALAAYLANPENAMFLKAGSRGGAGGNATGASATRMPEDRPQSYGHALIQMNQGRNLGGAAFSDKYRN